MPPTLLEVEQRSEEWLEARKGKITASLAAACLGLDPHRGPLSAFNEITGRRQQRTNPAMRYGVENEARAREAYEVETGNLVVPTGFWVDDELPWLGASPDGLVGDDCLVEIKCPGALTNSVPVHHAIQMDVQMAVTGRSRCDYFSWTPDGYYLCRFQRDREHELTLLGQLQLFWIGHIQPNVAPKRRPRKGGA